MLDSTRQKSTFGAWLKQRRKELDLTQIELSGKIGCAADTVKKMESGVLRPSKQLAELMAVFFGIPIRDRGLFIQFARGLPVAITFETATHAGNSASIHKAPPQDEPETLFRTPVPVTSLVGRTREVHAATTLLLQGSTRLLTLYGPPGVGKTRLSLEIAARLQSEFAHGVCFIQLAPIIDASSVLPAIASSMKLKEMVGESLLQTVQSFLADRQMLLVIDNFEQVIEAAPVLHDLLTAAPGVKALVSSREVLKLYGEQGFPLPPLEVPDVRAKAIPPLEAIALYPSVELFVQRARANKPDFILTRANASVVAHICAWLDGLPLAIEMAAAQVKWMPLPRLLAELSDRLTELTGGMRDLSPRQQTLRGAIDWSFQLLNPADRVLFSHLAIFIGGFTADAAMEVTGDPLHDPIPSALEQLADKSLLRSDAIADADGNMRFSMFEMIREYALETLAASSDLLEVGRRHALYYMNLARQAEPDYGAPREALWMSRLNADLSNIRAALDWFTINDPVRGLQMAVLLSQFYSIRGDLTEVRTRFKDLLALAGDKAPPLVKGWALRSAAALAHHQGDWQQSTALADQCLEIFREQGAQDGVSATLHLKGGIAFMRSDYAQATALFSEALRLYREIGNLQSAGTILRNLGLIAKDLGDYRRAIILYDESMALHRSLGNMRGIMATLTQTSIAYYWMGDYTQSATIGEQALELYRGSDNRLDEAYALENLGMIYYKLGDYPHAERLLNESLDMMRDLGNRSGMAMVYTDYGQVAFARGEAAEAADLHRKGLHYSTIVDDKRRIAFCLEGLGIALGVEAPAYSARLFGAAEHLRVAIGSPLPPSEIPDYKAGVEKLRAALGDALYKAEYAAGEAMVLEAVIASAMAQPMHL